MKEEKKLGQEPAFPNTDAETFCNDGMSKRFYAACAAMQGILATSAHLNLNDQRLSLSQDVDVVIKLSYYYADELLKQENDDIPKNGGKDHE